MPISTFTSFLALAKEVTKGMAVAPTAFIPVTSLQPQDDITYLVDAGWRGSQVDNYGNIQGVKSATVDFGGDLYPDTFGYVIGGLLGDVTTTGAADPFSHAFSVLNTGNGQPTSYTLLDYDGIDYAQHPGAQFSEAQVDFTADGALTYTAKASAFGRVTTTAPTKSYSTVPLIPSWRGAATIGGVADATIISGNMAIKRKITIEHTLSGSQAPYAIWVGPCVVTGKLTFLAESSQLPYLDFLNGTTTSLDLLFSQGATTTVNSLELHSSAVTFTVGTVNRGKEAIEFDITYVGSGNTTDAGASGGFSPIKATVQSALPAGTYV